MATAHCAVAATLESERAMTLIGTVRPEEAKVFDSHKGFHQFHAEETQEPHGSFEVFWHDGGPMIEQEDDQPLHFDDWGAEPHEGWYWWPCFPGCLPDGDPSGPFASSRQAHEDADECSPEYDDC